MQAVFTYHFARRTKNPIYGKLIMKKIFLLILLTAIVLSCCLSLTACGPIEQPEIPDDADLSSKSLAPDGRSVMQCTPEENLFMATHVMGSLGFKAVNNGTSKAVGITQKVYSQRTVLNGAVFSQTASLGFVKLGKQFYYENGSYVVRDASKVKDVDDVEWESGAKRLSKARFQSLYGLPSVSLTAFVTNDDSVKEGVFVEENDGVYTFHYKLDNVVSVYYLKYQMRTYSGSKGFPVFDENDGIVMTVKMDGDRKVSSISTVCSYKVDMLGGVKCEERLEEVFYDVGNVPSIPERSFFEPYLTASITDTPDAETVSGVLMDTFMPLIKDNSLCADVEISGALNVDAKLKAVVDTQNLENLTLDLIAPALDLSVSYRKGKLALKTGDLNAYLNISDLTGGEESASDGQEESLFEKASLITNGNDYTVLLPLGPITAEINAVKNKDGGFDFADAVLGPLVVKITQTQDFDAPYTDAENGVNLLPLLKQFVSDDNTINIDANIAGLFNASLGISVDGGGLNAMVCAGEQNIYAKIDGKSLALRYGELKMKFGFKDALNALFNRFYELNYVKELFGAIGGLTDSIQLGWNGVSKHGSLYVISLNVGEATCDVLLEEKDGAVSLHSAEIPVGEKKIVLSLAEKRDFSPVADTEDYPDGTGLLDVINERLEIDLFASVGDFEARLLFDLKSPEAKLALRPVGNSELKMSVMSDGGEKALFVDCGDFRAKFGGKELLGQGTLLVRLLERHSAQLKNLLQAVFDGTDMTVSADTARNENGVSLVLGAAGLKIEINFSEENGRLVFESARACGGGASASLAPFKGDENEFSFIENTKNFKDGSSLLPLDEAYILNAAVNAGGTVAYVSVNLWDASVKAVVPDLYEHKAYVSLDLYSSEIKFKYGGLQLKTDAAGIGKLISFAVPLIGDENLEALLGALGSIDFDIKAVFDSFKATAFDENGARGVDFGLNLGGIDLNARVSETESAYAPESAAIRLNGTEIKLSPSKQPDFSELEQASVFPEVTSLLDMFADYKLAFEADINGVKAKIGLDVLNGEVHARAAGLSVLYFTDVRETAAGQEKYGKALIKYGALEAQADVARLAELLPTIVERLGTELPKAQIVFNPTELAGGFSTADDSLTLDFNIYADGKPINIKVLFKITEKGLTLDNAAARYENLSVKLVPCGFDGFWEFDREGDYLDLNALADDYAEIILDLVTARGWQIDASGSVTTQTASVGQEQTETETVSTQTDFTLTLCVGLSEESAQGLPDILLSLVLTDGATQTQKTALTVVYGNGSIGQAPAGTLFVDYNGLKARVATDSLKMLSPLLDRATLLVPALGDMLKQATESLSGAGEAFKNIDLQTLLESICYKDGVLSLEVAENALFDAHKKFSLSLSQTDGLLSLAANGVSLTANDGKNITARADVAARSLGDGLSNGQIEQAAGDVKAYTSFDSLPDLLKVVLNTAETRHIEMTGVAKVQITVLSKEVPLTIRADMHGDGRITAVVSLSISGKIIGLFKNVSLLGGSHEAYMYIDSASDCILMKRIDTLNKAFGKKEVITSYCKIAYTELGEKGLDILYFMTDLSDSICAEISTAVAEAPDNPFRIENVFESYVYEQNTFKLEMNLSDYNPTLGEVSLTLCHDENKLLTKLNASMELQLTENLSGTVELIDMTVSTQETDLGTKAEVEAEQNGGNY